MINFITILAALSFLNLKCGSVNPSNKRLKERKTNNLLLSPRDQFGCSQPIWVFIMYWWFISKPWRFCWWSLSMDEFFFKPLSSLPSCLNHRVYSFLYPWITKRKLFSECWNFVNNSYVFAHRSVEGLLLKKMRWVIEEGLRSGTVY